MADLTITMAGDAPVTSELLARETAAGLLFIGDPQVSSRRIGRRKEQDFLALSVGKLGWCLDLAERLDLLPVIPGDLVDQGDDDSARFTGALIRAVMFNGDGLPRKRKPVLLWGNHDATIGGSIHRRRSEDHVVSVLVAARCVHLIEQVGQHLELDIGGRRIVLGGSPYSEIIPDAVDADGAEVIWLTHHDLDFPGSYPGAKPCPEIKGCALLVNGHMHRPADVRQIGGTACFNPGNILRMTVDEHDRVPLAWSWVPGQEGDTAGWKAPAGFVAHVLPHAQDVFDMTGRQVDAIAPSADAADAMAPTVSRFVEAMKQQANADLSTTDDGSGFADLVYQEVQSDEVAELQPIIVRVLQSMGISCAAEHSDAGDAVSPSTTAEKLSE